MTKTTRIRTELLAQQPQLQQIANIQTLLLHLEAKGKAPSTIRAYEQNLKALSQRANLQNPQEIELAIARYKRKKSNQPITNNYKGKLCDCYATFCKFYKIDWEARAEVRDIHLDSRTITARIHKGCNARPPLPVTLELSNKLQDYIAKHHLSTNDNARAREQKFQRARMKGLF